MKLLTIFLPFLVCQAAAESTEIRVVGASSLSEFMRKISSDYALAKKIRIPVSDEGGDAGIKCLMEKTCHVATASRNLPESALRDVKAIRLGWDSVAIVAHKNLPISSLTRAELGAILSGKATNWKQFGGPNANIVFFPREKSRGGGELLEKFLDVKIGAGSESLGSSSAVLNRILRIPNSISYMSLGLALDQPKSSIRILKLDEIEPSLENIRTKQYPLFRPLNVFYRKEAPTHVENFVKFIQKSAVDRFRTSGFIADSEI